MLSDNDRDRNTKLQALLSLGDLAINAPKSFCMIYLSDTIKILQQASEVSLNRTAYKEDQDVLDYLSDLKTNILNCYSTIISGAKDANQQVQILSAAPNIFNFLERSLSD